MSLQFLVTSDGRSRRISDNRIGFRSRWIVFFLLMVQGWAKGIVLMWARGINNYSRNKNHLRARRWKKQVLCTYIWRYSHPVHFLWEFLRIPTDDTPQCGTALSTTTSQRGSHLRHRRHRVYLGGTGGIEVAVLGKTDPNLWNLGSGNLEVSSSWGYPSSWMLDFRENRIVRKGWLKRGTPTKRKPQFLMWGKGCHEPPSHHLSIIAGVCIPSDGSLIVLPRFVPIQNIWINVF